MNCEPRQSGETVGEGSAAAGSAPRIRSRHSRERGWTPRQRLSCCLAGKKMKSARLIKMDYNAMLQKAGSLEDLAERLYRIADSIDRENDRIASGWTGNASGEYRKKISRERNLVRRRAQQLSQSAQGVRRAAKRMYDTEMFALSLFSRR